MAEEGGDLDSWEHQADSGMLDKRLEEMTIEIQQSEDKKKLHQASKPQVVAEESSRTQYQPQVRILRRDTKSSPNNDKKMGPSSGSQGSSKHSKSLQQREAEYAEARLRIFGCLPPNDDDDDDQSLGGEESAWGDKSENESSTNSSVIHKSMPQILKPELSETHVSVLRQPRGPDGTNGFNKPDHT